MGIFSAGAMVSVFEPVRLKHGRNRSILIGVFWFIVGARKYTYELTI
jgi:hypothetical protein